METLERMLQRCRWIGLIDAYSVDEQGKTHLTYKGAHYALDAKDVKDFLRMIVRSSSRHGLLHDLDES